MIGQDRSGKTSLKKSLQGLPFNPKEDSTVGIDVDPSHFKVTTENWKAGQEDQAANKEEMLTSFENRVARVVVENLGEQELTSESNDPTELSPTININHSQVGSSVRFQLHKLKQGKIMQILRTHPVLHTPMAAVVSFKPQIIY